MENRNQLNMPGPHKPPTFFLLTDFGLQDPYVGQMKAVLWSLCPQATILDLSHGVQAHNAVQAGFFLASSWPYLPEGSIGLAVVDPGVGTSRPLLLFEQNKKSVLTPDNGLIGLLLTSQAECRVWRINSPAPKNEVSASFHGRDVFAPLACRLAEGVEAAELGTEITPADCRSTHWSLAVLHGNQVQATVMHVDGFGNCILNLDCRTWGRRFPAGSSFALLHPRRESVYAVSTYARIPEDRVGLLAGSQGYLELACNQCSCARHLDLAIGDACVIDLG